MLRESDEHSATPVGGSARVRRLLRLFTFLALVVMANSTAVATAGTPSDFKPVPEATFHALDGTPVAVSTFQGSVVLINFWGTWCAPCFQEIPELVRLSHQFKKRGLEVVGVAVDSGRPEDIREFMAEYGMDYQILVGDMSIVKSRFRVLGFPTSLLIDRQGLIRKRYFGPQTEEALKKDVEPLLE